MKVIDFFLKNIFLILSMILILCLIDQIYLMIKYKDQNIETFFLTLCLTGLNIYWALSKIKK